MDKAISFSIGFLCVALMVRFFGNDIARMVGMGGAAILAMVIVIVAIVRE